MIFQPFRFSECVLKRQQSTPTPREILSHLFGWRRNQFYFAALNTGQGFKSVRAAHSNLNNFPPLPDLINSIVMTGKKSCKMLGLIVDLETYELLHTIIFQAW